MVEGPKEQFQSLWLFCRFSDVGKKFSVFNAGRPQGRAAFEGQLLAVVQVKARCSLPVKHLPPRYSFRMRGCKFVE